MARLLDDDSKLISIDVCKYTTEIAIKINDYAGF